MLIFILLLININYIFGFNKINRIHSVNININLNVNQNDDFKNEKNVKNATEIIRLRREFDILEKVLSKKKYTDMTPLINMVNDYKNVQYEKNLIKNDVKNISKTNKEKPSKNDCALIPIQHISKNYKE